MKSIIVLIGVAIVVVAIKELLIKRIKKQNAKILKKHDLDLTDKEIKTQSRNTIVEITTKTLWFHLIFFITAIIIRGMDNNQVMISLYIIFMMFMVVYSIIQHKKRYISIAHVGIALNKYPTQKVQSLVSKPKEELSQKESEFMAYYNSMQKHFGMPITFLMILQSFISVFLWISTL